jgi:hypothetical protein
MFRDVLLDLLFEKFNLALTEIYQLETKNKTYPKDKTKLCDTILHSIASGEIKSVHLTQKEAKKLVEYLDKMYQEK